MDSAYFIGLDNEDGTQRQVMVIQETTGSNEGGIELLNNFKLNEGVEELGTVTFNDDYSEWTYSGNLNSDEQKQVAETIQRRFTQEQYGDYQVSENFSFMWAQDEETNVVKVFLKDGRYKVAINGEYVGDIKQDEDTQTWSMENFDVDTALVQEVGRKIEEHIRKF